MFVLHQHAEFVIASDPCLRGHGEQTIPLSTSHAMSDAAPKNKHDSDTFFQKSLDYIFTSY
jgi:hypothetical protein